MSSQVPNTEMPMRMMLLKGEVQRVKSSYRGLRVRAGQAWVTMNGRDLVLKRGEEMVLDRAQDAAVVSSLGHAPLVIELLGEAPRQPTADPHWAMSTR